MEETGIVLKVIIQSNHINKKIRSNAITHNADVPEVAQKQDTRLVLGV